MSTWNHFKKLKTTDGIPIAQCKHCKAELKYSVKTTSNLSTHLKVSLGRVSSIVSHVRRSTHATDILEGENRLQASNATRWNSQLIMVKSLLNVPAEKLDKLDCHNLKIHERNILMDLCEILTPFESATHKLQGQNTVTSSLVIPVVQAMTIQLEKLKNKYDSEFVKELQASFKKRIATYEEKHIFEMASALDPRFKLQWAKGEKKARLEAELEKKASAISHLITKTHNTPKFSRSSDDETSQPPAKKSRQEDHEDILDVFMEQLECPSSPQVSPIKTEVSSYLSAPLLDRTKDPLAYWTSNEAQYPHLARLAAKYLAVPASSAPVERLFSIGGMTFRPDRCRLSDKVFQELMFIRSNGHLL